MVPKVMNAAAGMMPSLRMPLRFYLDDRRIFGTGWTREQFYRDPLGLTSYSLYFLASLFSADMSFLDSGEIRCPIVAIFATDDALFSLDYTRRVYERIGAPRKEMIVLELDRHLIFNECLDEVLPSLVAKLEEYAG